MRHLMLATVGVALLGLAGPEVRAQQGEEIGDWVLRVRTEPFNDVQVTTAVLLADGAGTGISSVELRCDVGLWDESLSLVITHAGMGEGDGGVSLAYRLGSSEERTAGEALAWSDGVTTHPLDVSEIAALSADPQLAVTLIDPRLDESHQVSWTDVRGTDEVIARLPCVPGGR